MGFILLGESLKASTILYSVFCLYLFPKPAYEHVLFFYYIVAINTDLENAVDVFFCWQILEKCEELRLLKLDREKLLSEAADSEVKLKYLTEESGKLKEDLADAQLRYENSDREYVALKRLHEELELKYVAASENSEQMKLQVEHLSKEAEESKTALDDVKLEVSVILIL